MIILFGSILALGAAILVFLLAWQIIKFWRKIREEALVHFSFMFIYCGTLIIGMVPNGSIIGRIPLTGMRIIIGLNP